jgi:hypothetical protein
LAGTGRDLVTAAHQPFEPPDLALHEGRADCDIGFLSAADHRAAFAVILARFLPDNRSVLDGLVLTGVTSSRPVPGLTAMLPLSMAGLEEQADEAAHYLYDSLNETVTLEVSNPVAAKRLSIAFDNPTFELW